MLIAHLPLDLSQKISFLTAIFANYPLLRLWFIPVLGLYHNNYWLQAHLTSHYYNLITCVSTQPVDPIKPIDWRSRKNRNLMWCRPGWRGWTSLYGTRHTLNDAHRAFNSHRAAGWLHHRHWFCAGAPYALRYYISCLDFIMT